MTSPLPDPSTGARTPLQARLPRGCELVKLHEVEPCDIAEILAYEEECWSRHLNWDFSATAGLIARSVGSRAVSGLALRKHRRVVAYAYYLPSSERSLIGSIQSLPEVEKAGTALFLLERILDHLVHDLEARRLEAQFPYFGNEELDGEFQRWGGRTYERCFMRASLAEVRQPAPATSTSGFAVRPLNPEDSAEVSQIVHSGFIGSVDAAMSACYATATGCRTFVDGVISNGGCGPFADDCSFVASADGRAIGVILVSRVSPGVGHVVQVSVEPTAQGRGVGAALLSAAVGALTEAGDNELSLSVSAENNRAADWYASVGLKTVHRFSANVWHRG